MEGFCVKCKQKREITDGKEITFKNGQPAMQGPCSVCGTKMTVIISRAAANASKGEDPKPADKPADKPAGKKQKATKK